MKHADILEELSAAEAIIQGHFILSSGLHSDTYVQCARALMNPQRSARLCKALAEKISETLPDIRFDLIVSPAMGGVVIGYEMARQLNVDAIFCERENGNFTLRRGFSLPEKAKVLMIEDVVTTGKSSLEAFTCVESFGGTVVAEACLIDRSHGSADLGVPLVSLLQLNIQTFSEEALPDHLKTIPAIKPGSRHMNQVK